MPLELGGSNIVEDLALGLHLARQAAPPLFVESANVWSPPATAGGTLVQRRRWEGGYLATAFKQAPPAFVSSLFRFDLPGVFGALDLAVPPLSLLVVLNAVAFLLGIALASIDRLSWPVVWFRLLSRSSLSQLSAGPGAARGGALHRAQRCCVCPFTCCGSCRYTSAWSAEVRLRNGLEAAASRVMVSDGDRD